MDQAIPRPLTEVLTSMMGQEFGKRIQVNGNEYIFLKGVTGTVVGSFVTFDEVGVTALLAADAVGPVAIAMAILDAATKFGWYQIYGKASGLLVANVADNASLYACATAGSADDAATAGDVIHKAISRGATAGAAAVTTVQIHYPFVDNNVDDATA
jgi:hypothetical protein